MTGDCYFLIMALVDAIVDLQEIVVDLRKEVDVWNPKKPYQHDLYSDISVCFYDYRIAREYPELFIPLS